MRTRFLLLALTACGRLGFDATPTPMPGTDGDSDGPSSDTSSPMSAKSCESLPATCGPTGNASCCESLTVPGGTFFRSYDSVGYNTMTYPATVSPFRLDKYEVTVGRFRAFVDAGFGTQANPPTTVAFTTANHAVWDPMWTAKLVASSAALKTAINCFGTPTWTASPGANENRPMNCITWYEAQAFCIWDGGYLPTEAEWNFAAAGGDEQRAYPWSNPPTSLMIDTGYAAYSPDGGTTCPVDGNTACDVNDLLPVGSKPAGDARWGHSDMGGNVWEWTMDWYVTPYATTTCNDCVTLTNATGYQVIRGGCWNYSPAGERVGARAYDPDGPPDHDATAGVRCARPI
ncbi:MAG TPA: SUMF1/EgtB/PvdO family nonheme iron enzyme [Kofleriaceae bacterium]|nr:SUMF1/EgtB/PvdO family nonheme iron enzyme [Kofleriaceae bacterium]